ncbi:MAG: hypothetical protein ABI481_07085 [Pyrinomonadaceae bacterium]
MPDETDDREETTTEGQAKPTITIAEKEGSEPADLAPTITIAEKDGGK